MSESSTGTRSIGMTVAEVLTWIMMIIMVGALYYGFRWGDGWTEVSLLVKYPWFNVSLVDVYVGFALFCVWVVYREHRAVSVLWVLLILTLGNAIACLYAVIAFRSCGGSWRRFWLGRAATAD
ncbi:MAG: DUF1475 family protein [Planctomycetota bacterium]